MILDAILGVVLTVYGLILLAYAAAAIAIPVLRARERAARRGHPLADKAARRREERSVAGGPRDAA